MNLPLAPLLHAISQALLYPVLALLLLAAVYLAYQIGTFLTEGWAYRSRRDPEHSPAARRLAETALAAANPAVAAERLLAEEELGLARRLERTDLLVRLGPALGLAGTLIPLGPGLAALGRGEVQVLAAALAVAFDTTVLGVLIGGVAFVLSSIRRRWYEAHMLRTVAFVEDRLNVAGETRAVIPNGTRAERFSLEAR